MAVGDGITWDETTPTDASLATKIDDYNRDVRKGIRVRMAREHEFPASQTGTGEGGAHKHITLSMKTAAISISGTQVGGVYLKTVATTGAALFFINPSTQEVNISDRTYFWYVDGAVSTSTNASAELILVSDGIVKVAKARIKTTASGGDGVQIDVNYNGVSLWTATASQIILAPGSTSTEVVSFVVATVTGGGILSLEIDKVGTGTAGSGVTVMVEVG